MEERKLAVLRAIVDDYVQTHEPVGSKALVDRHSWVFPQQQFETTCRH